MMVFGVVSFMIMIQTPLRAGTQDVVSSVLSSGPVMLTAQVGTQAVWLAE